jgi:hypothetical protein
VQDQPVQAPLCDEKQEVSADGQEQACQHPRGDDAVPAGVGAAHAARLSEREQSAVAVEFAARHARGSCQGGASAGRPRQTTIRVLFVFDPWRSAILLVAGDKAVQWQSWYKRAIPQAEELLAVYLKERAKEEEDQ